VDQGAEWDLESKRLELVQLIQSPSEVGDVNMEDEMAGMQGKETEGESECEEDEAEDNKSANSKCTTHQSSYVAILPMKVVGKGGMGDWGLVSTVF
jgi:hypothetical protein